LASDGLFEAVGRRDGLPVELVADGGDRLLDEHRDRHHSDDQAEEERDKGDHRGKLKVTE
jgi:hypothetical protein